MYKAVDFSWFKRDIENDVEMILSAKNMPKHCQRVVIRIIIIYDPEDNKVNDETT